MFARNSMTRARLMKFWFCSMPTCPKPEFLNREVRRRRIGAKVGVVERVQELRLEPELDSLGDRDRFCDRDVEVREMWAVQVRSAADCAGVVLGEMKAVLAPPPTELAKYFGLMKFT